MMEEEETSARQSATRARGWRSIDRLVDRSFVRSFVRSFDRVEEDVEEDANEASFKGETLKSSFIIHASVRHG